MGSESTESSLLVRVRDPGDDQAWRAFDRKYRQLILRYCRGRGLQQSDAEDVRQVVMLSLSRSLRKFTYRPEMGRFRDYLMRVVKNAIFRSLSRPRAAAGVLDLDELESLPSLEPCETDGDWEREWMNHHYRVAMETVRATHEDRSVRMFEELLDDQSVREVARRHGTTEQAVHKVKQRIKRRLQELIAVQIREEEFPEHRR